MSMKMNDSEVSAAWIKEMVEAVPIQFAEGGNEIITGPVRFCFPNLLEPRVNKNSGVAKYGAALLFPPGANIDEINEENRTVGPINEKIWEIIEEKFEGYITSRGSVRGLRTPVRDQEEQERHGGFTPELWFLNATNKLQPAIIDMEQNPLDPALIVPGFWGIASINFYAYDQDGGKGVAAGLNSVMYLGPDTVLGARAMPAEKAFAGVNVPKKLRRPDPKATAAKKALKRKPGGRKVNSSRWDDDDDINDLM